ncbi:hypothetical protein RHSIM_Rhsim04G0192200 [Rhododendron simsii]|uniref:Uncharacterized protein n=1 Tax=Rhododendron simsii TaxID=118357 RepID=A0A834H5T3_RHOSS|nr:hypothetical protein RHSIM_Rhsim04G0192200 [Rhododendron simsii]
MDKLIEWKEDLIKEPDGYGQTPLHYAAKIGNVNAVKKLLAKDESVAYVSANDDKGNTALHMATAKGHTKVMEELLSKCPDCWEMVNSKGQNILHISAHLERDEATKYISEQPWVYSLVNRKDHEGNTPMHVLAYNDKGKLNSVLLFHRRADMKALNNEALTPYDILLPKVRISRHSVGKQNSILLLSIGGQERESRARRYAIAFVLTITAMLAMMLAFITGRLTKALLEWKKDLINQADGYGRTPLHYAACNERGKGSVKELLAMDISVAYITTTNKDGLETALHIAAAHGHVHVMEELLSYNPDCWEMVNSKGQNVLHIAVDMNRNSVIYFILGKSWVGQIINQKDNEGNTPLHLLIASDCNADERQKLKRLWKHPTADCHAFNGKNMTPVDLVCSNLMEKRMSTFAETIIVVRTYVVIPR